MIIAFTDGNGGYYQCESPDGSIPDWAKHMIPCEIMEPVNEVLTPLQEIQKIEAVNPITHRALRELSLAVAQIIGQIEGVDPMTNPAIQKLKYVDSQIAELRKLI